MKFIIEGREYSPASLGRLSLWDVMELKKQTTLTPKDIEASAEYLQAFTTPLDLLSDDTAISMLGAVIWLARWTAGDRITFEESLQVPMSDVVIQPDEDDGPAEEEPDPTGSAPLDSAPADATDQDEDEAAVAAV